jgi:hypothetical protein
VNFKLVLLATFISAPVLADQPATVVLPTPLVAAIQNYLRAHTYSEVADIMTALNACISVQVPDAQGHLAAAAICPGVVLPKPEKPDEGKKKDRK